MDGIVYCNERLMAADITVRGCKIRVISCYAPTLTTALTTKLSFYRELSKLSKPEKHRKILVQGDLNAELQLCRSHSRFDGGSSFVDEGTNQTNENSMLFLKYCQENKLCILNTWYDHPLHHRITWHHPNGTTKKIYDYSLSRSWTRQYITDVRVKNSYFNSDHRLLVTHLKTPCNKAARRFKRKVRYKKPDLQCIAQNDTAKDNVCTAINDFLENNTCPETLNGTHNFIINALTKGRDKIPKQTLLKSSIPWNQDSDLTDLHNQRIQLRKQDNRSPIILNKLKEVNKKIKKRVKEIKNIILKKQGQELNHAKQHRNIRKMWKNAKAHNSIITKKPQPIQCPGLKSHFMKHFNPDHSHLSTPIEIDDPPEFIKVLQSNNPEINNAKPTSEEILNAIKQLNNGKSSLDIEAEIVKLATTMPSFMSSLERYFAIIWKTKEIPKKWSISRITAIWKRKGNAMDPSKYRAISIGSVLSKIGMNIILKRMSSFYEQQLKNTQFGFRSGASCNDGIYAIKQLQDIASLSQQRLFACFIDLTAAFDHINRDLLFKTLKNRMPQNYQCTSLDIIKNLYQSTTSYLQNDNPDLNSFSTSAGVRQGGMEGPPLYNLYSDYAIRTHEKRKTDAGVLSLKIPYAIPNEATNRAQKARAPASGTLEDSECGYADDGVIFCWSEEELKTSMDILNQVFYEFGLNINNEKTETMVFNWQPSIHGQYPTSIITLNGFNIKNTTTFKYLGVWINHNDLHIGDEEVEYRINSAHNAFAENRKLLTNFNIKLDTRIMFFNAFVRTRLTYGCHAWKPSSEELRKLDSTHRFFLRSMLWNGHKRVNPPPRPTDTDTQESSSEDTSDNEYDWRYKVNNENLYRITKTSPINQYYENQQMKWMAHIIRRENNNICKILTFHTVKRTKRGRKTLSILERVVQKLRMNLSEFLRKSFLKQNW